MTEEQKQLFQAAILHACKELGDDLKKLSCFYPNWKNFTGGKADSDEQPLKEAA